MSSISWNSQDHNDRKLLIQKSHFILSGNSNTARWGLGEFNTSKDEFITEFKSIKPTIWGSDAHDNQKLFKPDLNRFTWVKAEVTFEGIRQVLFEPERVRIQENQPSLKNSYQVIKEINLIDTTNTLFSNNFRIGLNRDLNAIIGGKSSGKSLLLYHLAKTIMEPEKFKILSDIPGFQNYKDFPITDMQVIWEDGHTSNLNDTSNIRPIIYIPQMYLNYMAEYKSSNEDFKQTIDEILKGNTGYKEFIESKKITILYYEQQVDNEIKNYFSNLQKLQDLQRELYQLGDKVAIENNLNLLITTIELLRSAAGFTADEEKQYHSINESLKNSTDKKNELLSQKQLLLDLYQSTVHVKNKIPNFIEEEFSNLMYIHRDNEVFKTIISSTIKQISENLDSTIAAHLEQYPFNPNPLDEQILLTENTINENLAQLEPFNKKIKDMELFQEKQKDFASENKKLLDIHNKLKEIDLQKTKIDITKITIPYESLLICYKDIIEKNHEYRRISENIELISEVSFKVSDFERDFSNFITKNKTLQVLFLDHGFNGNNFVFSLTQHIDNIKYISQTILNGGINFNQGKQLQEMFMALFKNYFHISYDLKQGEDRLGHMSPGKKGIILFQLFLHMSSSRDPILIDQPEDNLDNRTVYKELNDFIKEKKLQRQIIIVSHNSNLVVSTDSENIIVAHQNNFTNGRPKFEYINGALENTFKDTSALHVLNQQGIREHVCEILEGGKEAFKKREQKYNI